MARTASYSGNFFSATDKTDEHIRSMQTWTIDVTLSADTWRSDAASNSTYRQILIDSILATDRDILDTGYESAMEKSIKNFGGSLETPNCVMVTPANVTIQIIVPPFSTYGN